MAPRIDPALPLVWRSPVELQLGAETPRVIIDDPGPLETGLIGLLRHGASLATVRTIGAGLDGSPGDIDRVLALLAPAFVADSDEADDASDRVPAETGARALVVVDGPAPFAARLSAMLAHLGHATTTPAEFDGATAAAVPALAVLAAHWVVPPSQHLRWLRADVPHLVVVDDDRGWRVGPLVEPGRGPCVRCLELERRDRDPAWPVIAAQLAGSPAPSLPRGIRALFDAAVAAAGAVDDRLRRGDESLIAASLTPGETSPSTSYRPHPECGCRAPAGIATAPAPLAGRRPAGPSSIAGVAVPA